jgi:hypothetical protein
VALVARFAKRVWVSMSLFEPRCPLCSESGQTP